jgi:hypothetical protein
MASPSSHSSYSPGTQLSNARDEAETQLQKTNELAEECSEGALKLRSLFGNLVSSIDIVASSEPPPSLYNSLMEMKDLCRGVQHRSKSIGRWDRISGQVSRLMDGASKLDRDSCKDVTRWKGLSGDLAGINVHLEVIKNSLVFADYEKANHISKAFKKTFIVSHRFGRRPWSRMMNDHIGAQVKHS